MTAGKEEGGSGEHRVEVPSYYGTFQDQPHFPQPVPPGQHTKGQGQGGSGDYYGTFQDQPHFPQPVPPSQQPHYPYHSHQRGGGYHQVPGYPSGDFGEYVQENPLPFCGLGFGWFLFILGFFCVIPWYIGAFIHCCLQHDYREKNGLLACVIIAVIFTFFGPGLSKALDMW